MSECLAGAAERLVAEFDGVLGPDVVIAAVRDAARDVTGARAGAVTRFVERSARRRLLQLL